VRAGGRGGEFRGGLGGYIDGFHDLRLLCG
jgi:hypothetical protein